MLYDVTNNVSLDHLYGSGGEGRELRQGGGEGSNNENQTSELQVVHVYKCTVFQGKRAKLGIFHNYGHDVLIFRFQPTPLSIQVHHFAL